MGDHNPGERQWARQDKSRGNISEMQVRERSGAVRRHEDTGPRRGDFGSNRKGTRLCCLFPVSSPTPLPMLHFIYCLILTLPSFVRSPFFAGSAWPMRSGRTTTEGTTPWSPPTNRGEQHFQLEEETPTDGIPDIVNSTELRSIVDAAELVEVPDGSGVWRLSRSAEEEALSWCR